MIGWTRRSPACASTWRASSRSRGRAIDDRSEPRLVLARAAGVGLVVEPLEQRHRLLGVGAGVGVPGLGAKLKVERLADHVEDRLLRRAHGALGVAQDLAGDRL